ncbi:MAG: Holliday junction branch migration protein RuvA [Candidatus Gastranaerophilales bacterium]|nr:Holliday junction branch migration protein RuvA [Candidatus Gastranaerophilales bacterium]
MYDYFKGILADKKFPYCTLEVSGIGYRFLINLRTLQKLPDINSEIKIYSKLIHKEDSMLLCGFLNKQDRTIFDILTAVSGIGTKVAFALLDEFETDDLVNAVISGDDKLISRTKGVGAKMAQKIVLELKDKLTKLDITADLITSKNTNSIISDETINQTVTILQSLGYNKTEYQNPLEQAISVLDKDDSQELLKEVLKILSLF